MPLESIDSLWFYKGIRDCDFLDDNTVAVTTPAGDVWKIPLGDGEVHRLFKAKEVLAPVARALGKQDYEETKPAAGGYPRLAVSQSAKFVIVNTHDLVLVACPLPVEELPDAEGTDEEYEFQEEPEEIPIALIAFTWGLYYPQLAFSPDGNYFSAGSDELVIFEVANLLPQVRRDLRKCAWDPSRRRLLAVDQEGTLCCLDLENGLASAVAASLGTISTESITDAVVGLAVSPSGQACFVAYENGQTVGHLALWQLNPFKLLASRVSEAGPVYDCTAPHHGQWVAIQTLSGVQLWDPATLEPLSELIPGATNARFSPGGNRFVTFSETDDGERRATIWEITDRREAADTVGPRFSLTALERIPQKIRNKSGPALYQAALEAPLDDVPRLAYADWLSQHGDPRGEFIRLQIQANQLPDEDIQRQKLEGLAATIYTENYSEWFSDFHKLHAFGCYCRRGLVEEVGMDANKFAWNGDRLCRMAPIAAARLEFRPLEGTAGLAKATALENLTELNLQGSRIGYDFGELGSSPHLVRLRKLNVECNGMYTFVPPGTPWLANLTHLLLGGNSLRDEALLNLVAVPGMPRLQELRIGYNRLTPHGIQAFAASPHQAELTRLSVCGNSLGDEGIQTLASGAKHWPRLTALDVSGTGMTGAGLAALLSASYPALKELHLRNLNLSDDDLRLLASSPLLTQLEVLSLRGTRLSDAGTRWLAESEGFLALERLYLNPDDVSPENWKVLHARFTFRLSNGTSFDWGYKGEWCAAYINNDDDFAEERIAANKLIVLGKTGWQENLRRVGAAFYAETLTNQGYYVPDCVRKFFQRFGALSLNSENRIDRYVHRVQLNTFADQAGEQTSPTELAWLEERVGARLCPIGVGYNEELLLMDEHERVFGVNEQDELYCHGDSGLEFFTCGRWPFTDDDRWPGS